VPPEDARRVRHLLRPGLRSAPHAGLVLQELPAEPPRRGLAGSARKRLGLPTVPQELRARLCDLLQLWPLQVRALAPWSSVLLVTQVTRCLLGLRGATVGK
jgi:hypothetical protein